MTQTTQPTTIKPIKQQMINQANKRVNQTTTNQANKQTKEQTNKQNNIWVNQTIIDQTN